MVFIAPLFRELNYGQSVVHFAEKKKITAQVDSIGESTQVFNWKFVKRWKSKCEVNVIIRLVLHTILV